MIINSNYSGVLTTCDIKNLSPYYVINYSDGKDTSAATSGNKETKNYYLFKDFKPNNKKFRNLITLAKELENKFQNNFLDIEFAVKKGNNLSFSGETSSNFK